MRPKPSRMIAKRHGQPSRQQLERAFHRRVVSWLSTTAITWVIWAMAGAPTGLPRGTGGPHHLVITLGIWPAYVMFCGLADLAKRSYQLYAKPLIDAEGGQTGLP